MAKKDENKKPVEDDISTTEKVWRVPKTDLVAPTNKKKYTSNLDIDFSRLKRIVLDHSDRLDDAAGIMETLPDLEIVKETLVASILSPKDLKEVKLNITINKNAPPEIAELVRDHFTSEFNLESKLSVILEESLFTKGSYILMTLPPNAIRKIIVENTYGLESAKYNITNLDIDNFSLPNIGLLHSNLDNVNYSLESITDERNSKFSLEGVNCSFTKGEDFNEYKKYVEISDNCLHLIRPAIKSYSGKKKVSDILKNAFGMEAVQNTVNVESIYLSRSATTIPLLTMSEDVEKETEFNPVVLTLPQESVIPVHVPGEPTNHVGYYVFLDEDGNPIRYTSTSNKFKELNTRLNNTIKNQTLMNNIGLGVTYANNSVSKNANAINNRLLLEAYYKKFENDLKEKIAKGGTGQTVEISNPGELYRIMFARQLEKQKTKVIYVPKEMISYIAFNYNETGTGISLIEKTKLISSFRAVLMFATLMAHVKSSVNLRTLSITLDQDDPDPTATVESILNETVALSASGMPLGRTNPLDIVDSLQKSGLQIKVDGGTRYPNTNIDLAETKRNITPPSLDLSDMLRDMHYSALWVNPETITRSADIDFASTLTSINLLQAKRITEVQTKYTAALSGVIKNYIYMGGPLYTTIKEKYNSAKSSLTLEEVIDSIAVTLPKQDNAVILTQAKEYADYCTFIETAVDSYISDGMIKDLLTGEYIGLSIDDVRNTILDKLKRDWLRGQNMLPELDTIIINEDNNATKNLELHNDNVIKFISEILRHVKKTEHDEDEKTKEEIDKLNPPPPEEETTDVDNPSPKEGEENTDISEDNNENDLDKDLDNPDESDKPKDDDKDTKK